MTRRHVVDRVKVGVMDVAAARPLRSRRRRGYRTCSGCRRRALVAARGPQVAGERIESDAVRLARTDDVAIRNATAVSPNIAEYEAISASPASLAGSVGGNRERAGRGPRLPQVHRGRLDSVIRRAKGFAACRLSGPLRTHGESVASLGRSPPPAWWRRERCQGLMRGV